MEEKLDKKTAKKLAQEKLLLQLKKDTLAREEALDQITLNKIREKWNDALLHIKIPEMQDNLRHILHYMEKLIEADTFRKLLFEEERQEIDERTILQAQSHSSALETLFDIYRRRIQDLHQAYKDKVFENKFKAEEEFKMYEHRESIIQENVQTMLYQMQQNRDQKEDVMNCDMFLKLDDERSKNTEKYESLKSKLEKKMEKRWGEIKTTLADYEANTRIRRKDYIQLKAKDDADSKIINQQMKKTQKLFWMASSLADFVSKKYFTEVAHRYYSPVKEDEDARSRTRSKDFTYHSVLTIVSFKLKIKKIKHLVLKVLFKKKMEQLEELKNCYDDCYAPKEKISLIADLREEKTKFFEAFKYLKAVLAEEMKVDENHLKNLTVITNDITKDLRKICEKGEQILTLFRICRKLETEQEKVIPVGGSLNLVKQTTEASKTKKAPEEAIISYYEPLHWTKDYDILNKFWKKVAKIQLSKLALSKCIQDIQKENLLLKKSLTSYLYHLASQK